MQAFVHNAKKTFSALHHIWSFTAQVFGNWAACAQFIKSVDFSVRQWTLSMINPVTQRALCDP